MDFSAANTALWNPIIQIGIIALLILLANVLRRKIKLIQQFFKGAKIYFVTAIFASLMMTADAVETFRELT